METKQLINDIKDLIDASYSSQIISHVNKDNRRVIIPFKDLVVHSPEMANMLLDEPEEFMKSCEIAISGLPYTEGIRQFKVRFSGVTNAVKYRIRDIRAEHIDKLIKIEGYIKTRSDIKPNMLSIKFECPTCGNIINVLQLEETVKEPRACSCGRKGHFKIIHKDLINAYSCIIEEPPESITYGTSLGRVRVLLKNDLCHTKIEERIYQGTRVCITGILKEVMLSSKLGGKKTAMDFYLEANYIDFLESTSFNTAITEKDKDEINKYLSDGNALQKLKETIFQGVFGMDKVKEGVVLSIIEGRTDTAASPIINGKIHILMIGDPGQGKTLIFESIEPFITKFRFVSGKGATGVGIMGAVIRDELTGGFSFDAGALALANDSICGIDEADKLTDDDRNALHQPMSQLKINISKANIQSTLRARTTVILGANPKYGRFDPMDNLYDQINLPPTLINRCDLIYVLKQDYSDEGIEEEGERALMQLRRRNVSLDPTKVLFIKKVISFLVNLNAVFAPEVEQYISNKYKLLIKKAKASEKKGVPITQRQVSSIAKIAEAHAKVARGHQSINNTICVDESDVDYAMALLDYTLKGIAYDEQTGQIDLDRITIGIGVTERSYLSIIKEIFSKKTAEIGKLVPAEVIIEEAGKQGISEDKVEETLGKMKKAGDIYEPRNGHYSKV